jgi:hypothetical protein
MVEYSIVMYSHSSYSDAWEIFFEQTDKYFDKSINRYVFSDEGEVPKNWTLIKYDNSDEYNNRVAKCFDQIDEKYCIFHHEDMPLYDLPDINFINEKVQLMEDDSIDCIRLTNSGDFGLPAENYKDYNTLFYSSKISLHFTIHPSLFKINTIKELYRKCTINKFHEFELNAHKISISMNLKNLYYYGGEPKRGRFHCDSNIYPYIATAIVKGKWNYSEYKNELTILHNEYKIDKNIRGYV